MFGVKELFNFNKVCKQFILVSNINYYIVLIA